MNNLFSSSPNRINWLIFCFVFISCNQNTRTEKLDVKESYKSISLKGTTTSALNLKLNNSNYVDTFLTINGKPKNINGLSCYVQYSVIADSGKRDSLILVSIDSAFLITTNQKIPLNSHNLYKTEKNIKTSRLEKRFFVYRDILTDKNKDGHLDIEVMTELAHNCYFDVFTFDPKTKLFEFSEIFSGFPTSYNKKLRRVSSGYNAGVAFHINQYINLKKDEKTIAFKETIRMDGDTFSYKKEVDKKVIKEKTIILPNQPHEYFNEQEWLERGKSSEE